MSEELQKWFEEEVLPELIETGKFSEKGEKQALEKCEFESFQHGVFGFASFPAFARLVLTTPDGTISRDILIKFQSRDPDFRETMKLVPQFQNEITMYSLVLPTFADFLKKEGRELTLLDKVVAKFYAAKMDTETEENSIIVMEDLRKSNYKMAEVGLDLDLKHCLLAVERLAQFHAISFAMKQRNDEAFENLKNSFVDVWLEDKPGDRRNFYEFRNYTSQRGIDYLLNHDSEVPKAYLEKFKNFIEPIFELLKGINSPQEPISVICHGDFNNNNVMFRYENGDVIDAKLIDFQTALYASPCLDLSFFIYMNTTLEFREKHFDDVFQHYYSNLIKSVAAILGVEEESIAEKLPLKVFKDDFGRVAVNAYVIVSFFLPVMMAPAGGDFVEDMKTKTFRQMAEENYQQGGEVVSRRIADVIIDFYRRKFYT